MPIKAPANRRPALMDGLGFTIRYSEDGAGANMVRERPRNVTIIWVRPYPNTPRGRRYDFWLRVKRLFGR